jgi:hypothetical protein
MNEHKITGKLDRQSRQANRVFRLQPRCEVPCISILTAVQGPPCRCVKLTNQFEKLNFSFEKEEVQRVLCDFNFSLNI